MVCLTIILVGNQENVLDLGIHLEVQAEVADIDLVVLAHFELLNDDLDLLYW